MTQQQPANLEILRRFLRRLIEDETRQGPRRHDKRRHERHYCMTEARAEYVHRLGAGSPDAFTMFTKDISRSGISFVHEHEMLRDEIVRVEMNTKGMQRTLHLRIVRCRRAGLRVFDIAGEFITEEEAATAALAKPKSATA